MLGFNGGLMGVRRTPTGSAATGLWFQNEQSVAKRDGDWPGSGGYRYWRFANFASTALDNNSFDLTEVELNDGNGLITGITVTANFPWSIGSLSIIVDGTKSVSNRALRDSWSIIQQAATLAFDLGSAKSLTSLKVFSLYHQSSSVQRFPASFDLQVSNNGITYAFYSTVTIGTSFTHLGGGVYSSSLISL